MPKADCAEFQRPLLETTYWQSRFSAQQRQAIVRQGCTVVLRQGSTRASLANAVAFGFVTTAAAAGCPSYAPTEYDAYFDTADLYLGPVHMAWFHNNWGACMSYYDVWQKWHSCDGWTQPGYGWDREWCGIGEGGQGTNYVQWAFNWDWFPWTNPLCKKYGKNRSYDLINPPGYYTVGDTAGFPCYNC